MSTRSKSKNLDRWQDIVGLKDNSQLAHIAVDVQKVFCDKKGERGNNDTDKVASEIAKISPIFRSFSIPNYWIHCMRPQTIEDHDLYKVIPEPEDIFVQKRGYSAFDVMNYYTGYRRGLKGVDIDELLTNDGKDILLVSGVNYVYCVCETVMDAREKGYEVILLSDLSTDGLVTYDNPPEVYTKRMKDAGVVMIPSAEVLDHLHS